MSQIRYPDLPILLEKQNILSALSSHPVIIVAGETGSGKTTQLPKFCLEAGLGVKKIGHTQPRRIAARSVAFRVASELETSIGQLVGYKIRFSDQTSENTRIQLMTDGILLAESQQDKWLSQYDCLIIDEAHERSLNIDFILGFLKNLLKKRHDLKVIVTSATIDVEKFSQFFNNAPLITIPGRTYPVEVNYQPLDVEEDDPALAIAKTVTLACSRGPGDILIFQSGEKEIKELEYVLKKSNLNNTHILPLYGRLSNAEQQKIFDTYSGRKIILATNVAETSITVPNIRFVIDPGYARISRYNYRSKLQRLPIEAISQASAEQRKGRCGRVGPGICYRLYAEDDLLARPLFTEPEILRVNLAGVILRMLDLGFRPVETFPLLDPLDPRYIKDGLSLLERLEAIDEFKKITKLGRQLAKIPLEPKFSRILIGAAKYSCVNEILIIVSALSINDPREWQEGQREKANEVHAQFTDPRSDFLFYINLWTFLFEHKQTLSHKKFRLLCRENYLSYVRVCEWFDVVEQLNELIEEMKLVKNQVPSDYSQIHKALLTGLLDGIGIKEEKGLYKGARNVQFLIHPGSALFKKAPNWIMACEIVHTSKTFGRTNASIEPRWVEEVGANLLKRQYFEPHFDSKEGRVLAFEKVTLFGLELVSRRKVSYENVSLKESREQFIREGLCEEKMRATFPFYEKNHQAIQAIRDLEHRIRKDQALFNENALYEFYDKHLPHDIASFKALEKWLKDQDANALMVSPNDLVKEQNIQRYDRDFPVTYKVQGVAYSLEYELDLSSPFDGVTLVVPIEALRSLKEEDFSWLIPGLLPEKMDFAIRSLPKKQRISVSVPSDLPRDGTFIESLSSHLNMKFDRITYPPHLVMHFKVIDENGTMLSRGDDLKAIYEELVPQHQGAFSAGHTLEKLKIEKWDFGDLPEQIQIQKGNLRFTYYPGLFEMDRAVKIQFFESKKIAEYHHPTGLARLALLYFSDPIKHFTKEFNQKHKKTITKLYSPFGTVDEFLDDLFLVAAFELIVNEAKDCRTEKAFQQKIQDNKNQFLKTVQNIFSQLLITLEEFEKLQAKMIKSDYTDLLNQLDNQIKALFCFHFIRKTPWGWLKRFSTYIKAMQTRLEKYPSRIAKDKEWAQEVIVVQKAYQSKLASIDMSHLSTDDPIYVFRFRIEELRVSLFAEALKTTESVSKIRLLKLLEKI